MNRKRNIFKLPVGIDKKSDGIWDVAQVDAMLQLVHAGVGKNVRFIDLGCGDGNLTKIILNHYPKSNGVLIDWDIEVLKKAKRGLKIHDKQLKFLVTDLNKSKWVERVREVGSFNLIVSSCCIPMLTDKHKQKLYKEIFSVLQSGGLFINLAGEAPSSKWKSIVYGAIRQNNGWSLCRRDGGRRTRQFIPILKRTSYRRGRQADVEVQCDWLRSIGFKDVDCYFKAFELVVFGGRKG